ncbi:MAG: L-lactate dehydrogenase [Synergistaceae bacterium]|jgi:L-lactate dehydrogenase|nr:L-lactate dehydrogenase [Synergistaceae bacterium]
MAKGRKISILGAGSVGATIAYTLAIQGIASEIVLIDIKKEKAIGEADDIIQGAQFVRPFNIHYGEYADAAGSDIVIFTLGLPRKPGMTRIDLVNTNTDIFKSVVPPTVKAAPDAIYVIVSNPVDIMTYVVAKLSGLPPKRIIGSGTLLDTARLRAILGARIGVSVDNIDAYVLAEHGDTSFIPWSLSSVFGVPATEYVEKIYGEKSQAWKDEVIDDVRKAGGRVIANKGATFFAVSLSACDICKNILNNTNTLLPVGGLLDGQYGVSDIVLSLPFAVGDKGITGGLTPKFTSSEEALFVESANALKAVCKGINI